MDEEKLKYVRLRKFDEIIIFPMTLNHSIFKNLDTISAGFCYIETNKVSCFGNSVSLSLDSIPEDSTLATKQIFGVDAMLEMEITTTDKN